MRDPVRRSLYTNQRALMIPPNRTINKDKLWAMLRESINLEKLSKKGLDAPVPGVTVRGLLSISPDLIQ